jgi:hypothetical protein
MTDSKTTQPTKADEKAKDTGAREQAPEDQTTEAQTTDTTAELSDGARVAAAHAMAPGDVVEVDVSSTPVTEVATRGGLTEAQIHARKYAEGMLTTLTHPDDAQSNDTMVAALLREREGYRSQGKDDRADQVTEQLKLRGHTDDEDKSDEEVRTTPPKTPADPPKTTGGKGQTTR